MYHVLSADNAGRDDLVSTVETSIRGGNKTLTIGLDGLPALDASVMGSLIVALRRMRETGGSVVLHVTRPELLRALSESGLDRVFKIVAQPESTPPKGKGTPTRTGGARRIAGGLA